MNPNYQLARSAHKVADTHGISLPADLNYVSWWPNIERRGPTGMIFTGPGEIKDGLFDDCEEEKSAPHVTYHIQGLDETEMVSKWRGRQSLFPSFNLVSRNCANVVWKILVAGGIKKMLGEGIKPTWLTHNAIWKPKSIASVLEEIRASNPTFVVKEKSFYCPSNAL